jgi:hypothetical protein
MRLLCVCALLIFSITFNSCAIQKEQRKCNRATKKIEQAIALCPQIAQTDTIRDTVRVRIPAVRIDTVLAKADTIEISKDRWRVRIITKRDSLYITGGCDSIYVEVPIEIPCDTIQPIKVIPAALKWWQIALMVLGAAFIIYIAIKIF